MVMQKVRLHIKVKMAVLKIENHFLYVSISNFTLIFAVKLQNQIQDDT